MWQARRHCSNLPGLTIVLTICIVAVSAGTTERLKSPRAAEFRHQWPGTEVPYYIDPSFDESLIPKLRSAMHRVSTVSCVRFRPINNGDEYWLTFENKRTSDTCRALIGFVEDWGQTANFGPDCSEGLIIHGLLHALGFFHEQQREDRDKFVQINWRRVLPKYKFSLRRTVDSGVATTTYGISYNYESIMHSGPTFGSKDPYAWNTIEVRPNHPHALGNPENMGQRGLLTQADAAMIRERYCHGSSHRDYGTTDPGPLDPFETHVGESS